MVIEFVLIMAENQWICKKFGLMIGLHWIIQLQLLCAHSLKSLVLQRFTIIHCFLLKNCSSLANNETCPTRKTEVMPRLQAIVRPLVGKNRLKSQISQVKRRTIALLQHDFNNVLPISLLRNPPVCGTRQGRQYM